MLPPRLMIVSKKLSYSPSKDCAKAAVLKTTFLLHQHTNNIQIIIHFIYNISTPLVHSVLHIQVICGTAIIPRGLTLTLAVGP